MILGTALVPCRPRFSVIALSLLVFGVSCAGLNPRPDNQPTATTELGGVWEGFAQGTIAEGLGAGDTRIERQSWHLRQDGAHVSGFYFVQLTMISGDGRPYVCSRQPQFQTTLRYEVRGEVSGSGVELLEIGSGSAKGPCRPRMRTPGRFHAAVTGDELVLRGSGEGSYQLRLRRRGAGSHLPPAGTGGGIPGHADPSGSDDADADETPREVPSESGEDIVGPTVPASLTIGGAPREEPVPVEGTWVWEHRGRLPTGDEKQEREEWHLQQNGAEITGYYDRSIRQVSTDGQAYRCSNATDFRVTTRYHLAGVVSGSHVILREKSFEILQASPCDSGRRNLDAYQGEAAIDELRLMWGVGSQVLRRERAEIPSQRF